LMSARRGTGSPWAEVVRELGAVDRAVYQAVARTPTPALDRPVPRALNAANYSRLWLGIAAAIFAISPERIWPDGCPGVSVAVSPVGNHR